MTSIRHHLLASAVLLLIVAGCSHDDDTSAVTAGATAVNFTAISTRTAGADGSDDAGSFGQYGTLHARLSYKGNTQDALLTYNTDNGAWTADKTIYWQSGAAGEGGQTLTLRRGEAGDFTLPDDMGGTGTAADGNGNTGNGNNAIPNYILYDRLFTSYTGPAIDRTWELQHCMAQIRVELSAAEGAEMPTASALASADASVSMTLPTAGNFDAATGVVSRQAGNDNTGQVKFHRPDAAQAVFYTVALPGETGTRKITITLPDGKGGQQTYRYTATADITLQAGCCHNFSLALGAGVKPVSVTTTGWTTAASAPGITEDAGSLTISNVTAGSLGATLATKGRFYKKVSVSGTLNDADYTALKDFVNANSFPVELEISVSNGNTVIPASMFEGSIRLGSVSLTGITEIGENAFNSSNLRSITLPENGLKTIGGSAFYQCKSLESVTIPKSVETWGNYAFSYSGLKTVILSEELKTIGNYAFYQCKGLESVTIPASVETLGSDAFSYSGLKTVTLSEGLKTIGESAFSQCESLESVTIPASVETWGRGAFSSSGLKTVTLSEGLKTIGESAFYQCEGLASVTIPTSVETLGSYAFSLSGLKTVILSEGLNTIGGYAFSRCKSLESVTIPASVKTLGNSAFSYSGLKTVILSEGLNTIGELAFSQCESLESVTIPASVKTLGNSAFSYSGLKMVTLSEGLNTIGEYAFSKCKSLERVTIPASVKTWGSSAFLLSGLKKITLSEGLKTIGEYAFYQCEGLESVTIPTSVETLGSYAFYSSGLKTVTLSEGLKRIDNQAFSGCPLEKVALSGDNAINIGYSTFNDTPDTKSLFLYGSTMNSEEAIKNCKAWIPTTWSKIYYSYKGSGTDKLEPDSYNSSQQQ